MSDYYFTEANNNDEYKFYIIMNSSKSPLTFLRNIYMDLYEYNQDGKILIDQIMHVGNNEKRFISVEYSRSDQSINTNKIKFVNIPKDNIYRRISCQYFKNKEILEYSLLTSIQKRMINKGIAI